MDDKKKKEYVVPKAEVISFADDDIITVSSLDRAVSWEEGEDFE